MTPVQTAVAPETSPVTSSSLEHREAEQMLIEEARRRQRRRQRVIATVISAIVAAAGVAYAVASGASSPRPRPISGQPVSLAAFPICTANHLHVSLSGEPNGAAGTIYYTLKFVNNGPECTVAPVVARGFNTTSSGYVGPWSHVYITSKTKTVVTSGQAAYVPLGVGDTANWPGSLCRASSVNAVRVALAGNHSLIGAVPIRTTVCTVTQSLHTQSASLNPSGV
ncbi:MAG: hypothetical protein ABSA07_07960 [Acidimicrobiales bacterium]|jgi:hypothetical protein